jgi:hypothetical protein
VHGFAAVEGLARFESRNAGAGGTAGANAEGGVVAREDVVGDGDAGGIRDEDAFVVRVADGEAGDQDAGQLGIAQAVDVDAGGEAFGFDDGVAASAPLSVTDLPMMTVSGYVPGATLMMSPGTAAATAAEMVFWQPDAPVGSTQSVAAEARGARARARADRVAASAVLQSKCFMAG